MRVARLLIYPVKSLDGQAVDSSIVLPSGAMQHDRSYALFDPDGAVVNAKRYPALHRLRSSLDLYTQRLILRDGSGPAPGETFHLHDDRSRLQDWLSNFFGFRIAVAEDRVTGFPDDLASPGPTVIATTTLSFVADWFALELDEVRARFRANIEIEGAPAFWEDGLFGTAGKAVAFSIGAQRLLGINPCQRCVVPTRDPRTGRPNPDFIHRFVERRRATLPTWASPERFAHFYKLTVNTRVDPSGSPSTIWLGDPVGVHGVPGEEMTAASATDE